MTNKIQVRLAQSKDEFESAYGLLQASRANWCANKGNLWLIKQHALPSTTTIIALERDRVVGAICLFGENPFRLPMEENKNLSSLRENEQCRLAEISYPGIENEDENILYALFHYVREFGSSYCHFEKFVFTAPESWTNKYKHNLGLKSEDNSIYTLNPNEDHNYSAHYKNAFKVEFLYPEKKFFLVAHQSMSADVLDYLFKKKTNLFNELNDLEIRVLQCIYNYGDYIKVIPNRKSKDKIVQPKHRRFPMNCQGELKAADGEIINLMVMDVSREGIKLKTEEPMVVGEVCTLYISIGVMKKTELIGRVIWVDEANQIAGLEVKSGDKNWARLIEYLEKDFLLCA